MKLLHGPSSNLRTQSFLSDYWLHFEVDFPVKKAEKKIFPGAAAPGLSPGSIFLSRHGHGSHFALVRFFQPTVIYSLKNSSRHSPPLYNRLPRLRLYFISCALHCQHPASVKSLSHCRSSRMRSIRASSNAWSRFDVDSSDLSPRHLSSKKPAQDSKWPGFTSQLT